MIARVYAELLTSSPEEAVRRRVEETLPDVVDMAEKLRLNYLLLKILYNQQHEDTKVDPKDIQKREFILAELLRFAALLDYSDHIGGRAMQPLICEFHAFYAIPSISSCHQAQILQENYLPSHLLPFCLDVLRQVSDDRDFIRQVVEIIQTLRESVLPPESTVWEFPYSTGVMYLTSGPARRRRQPSTSFGGSARSNG